MVVHLPIRRVGINCHWSRPLNFVALLAFALCLQVLPTFAAEFTGKVVGVTDGDTISVMHNGKAEKIGLNGIDCPEKVQAYSTKANQ